jgi:ribosome-associated protein
MKFQGEIMEKVEIKLRDEYIKLGQALKAAGVAQNGVEAKYIIQDGEAKVNGNTEIQRGKKLYDGDEVLCREVLIKIIK